MVNLRRNMIRLRVEQRHPRVALIADKFREAKLRWYGHVLYADEDKIAKQNFILEVTGKRPKGRPKQRWPDTLHNDL